VLLDDVVVVEEPVGGRSDVQRLRLGRAERRVGVVEDAPRLVEPRQQPRGLRARRMVALSAGELAGAGGELLGAEELAPDGPGDEVLYGGP
jgi:hypothetical protein